jgi:hypothetical protein
MRKDNICPTPPMGWNSWDCYGPAVNEEILLANAEYMSKNLKDYGWEYVVCDIQWSEPHAVEKQWEYDHFAPLCMDEFGRVIPAPNRFPSAADGKGFSVIAEKIHDMGLKFGIHIMRGVPRLAVHQALPVKGTSLTCKDIAKHDSTCRWNVDMYGVKDCGQAYYDSIFELYAEWGVDFVKVDDICNTNNYPDNPYSAEREIEMIRAAIDKCGRDMVLSLSPGPAVIEKAWHLRKHANMWRITDDFWDKWELLKNMFERCEVWERQGSPGCYPDCDMLPIGKIMITQFGWGHYTNFTHAEQITMMTLWNMFRSPLMIGAEMRENDAFTLSLLTNSDVLRLNKKSHGARQIFRDNDKAAWLSFDDEDDSVYVALFNLSDASREIRVHLDTDCDIQLKDYTARELWTGESAAFKNSVYAEIEPHGAKLYKLRA